MLHVHFGHYRDDLHVYAGPGTFDDAFENDWFENDLVRDMIKDIDKSDIIMGRIIESPVLGTMSPYELSGGVKRLILMMYHPEYLYRGSGFGDNCAKWMLQIAQSRDLVVTYEHLMRFPEPFEIHIMNTNLIVRSRGEFADQYHECKGDGWK